MWLNMRARCLRKSNSHYHRYGGRGIRVCERWVNSFINFITDMGTRPSPKHTIERKDNDKDYTSSNCIWATHKQQASNKSNNLNITYRGKTQCLTTWAKELGIAVATLHRWVKLYPVEEAMQMTPKHQPIILTYNGDTKSVSEWAKALGIKKCVITTRLRRGWSVNAALTQKTHRGVRCQDL